MGRVHNTCNTTPAQLQKKFEHAADFGVQGNYNPTRAAEFDRAIQAHVDSRATQQIAGSYRGKPVTLHLDPQSGLNVVVSPQYEFVTGWRLRPDQMNNVVAHGGLGGG